MKYGLMLPSRGPLAGPESLSAIAKRAEELGYHVLMFPDQESGTSSPDEVILSRIIPSQSVMDR